MTELVPIPRYAEWCWITAMLPAGCRSCGFPVGVKARSDDFEAWVCVRCNKIAKMWPR